MLQTLFPGERPMFQDDNAPVHTSRCVQTWLHEHDHEVEHLTWCPQSRDLNIIEPFRASFIRINWDRTPLEYAIIRITENRMRSMQYMKPDTMRILKILTCGKRA
ncbi:retrovirus-related Pol polyprotein from transposon 412 [Trichonephila clavipes]|uniref:Retrovirus-related Pol polyprotein from transposon 412 n=1 Tax=Trichonephila clavipes TaxID=2585209 RepID=A0A8X6UP33_TRICX|nr:retrovirus-related Pol polyprotein from transposon 412 [Trichonephila clavipes]